MRESSIQTAILNLLQLYENQGKLYFVRNNSGAAVNIQGRFIRFGRAGLSDITAHLRGGRTIFIEVKNEKGRLNPNQVAFQKEITELGYQYCVVRGVDEVETILKANL